VDKAKTRMIQLFSRFSRKTALWRRNLPKNAKHQSHQQQRQLSSAPSHGVAAGKEMVFVASKF
jgi:hypothetical protein